MLEKVLNRLGIATLEQVRRNAYITGYVKAYHENKGVKTRPITDKALHKKASEAYDVDKNIYYIGTAEKDKRCLVRTMHVAESIGYCHGYEEAEL